MYYLGVKAFNMLSSYMNIQSDNPDRFKLILQKFLYKNSLYSAGEYFKLKKYYLYMI